MKPKNGPGDSGEPQLELPWPEPQKINLRSTLRVFMAIVREKKRQLHQKKKKCAVSIERARLFTPGLYSPSPKKHDSSAKAYQASWRRKCGRLNMKTPHCFR